VPDDLDIEIDLTAWTPLPVFQWIARTGGVDEREMLRTFNCGVGMIAIVEPRAANTISQILRREGEKVMILGEVVRVPAGKPQVSYTGSLDL
jgi:phosphoribosylformylglycinamidine cyclo-ligase